MSSPSGDGAEVAAFLPGTIRLNSAFRAQDGSELEVALKLQTSGTCLRAMTSRQTNLVAERVRALHSILRLDNRSSCSGTNRVPALGPSAFSFLRYDLLTVLNSVDHGTLTTVVVTA